MVHAMRWFVTVLCVFLARESAPAGTQLTGTQLTGTQLTGTQLTGTQLTGTQLTIRDGRFAIDGSPVFLVGMSYYGALGAPEAVIRSDLDQVERRGLRWIRVWATWSAFENDVSAVDGEGRAREPFLTRLRRLVEECDRRRIVVDVTLSRGNGVAGSPRLQGLEAHRRAVETIVSALKEHRNWYLDLSNERNIRDKRFTSFRDLEALRETVRSIDPLRLVTASHGGDIDRDDLAEYLKAVRVDFIAPHRPRDSASPAMTESKTREYIRWMREIGREVPVHYQEPFRRGYGEWEPRAEDYLTDVRGARAGGAAGWCLHNGETRGAPGGRPRRSFDLREKGLFDELDVEESKAVEKLGELSSPRSPGNAGKCGQ